MNLLIVERGRGELLCQAGKIFLLKEEKVSLLGSWREVDKQEKIYITEILGVELPKSIKTSNFIWRMAPVS